MGAAMPPYGGTTNMKRISITLQNHGAFDMPNTLLTLVAPEEMVLGAVAKIARSLEEKNSKINDPTEALEELISLGFEACQNINLTIGGNNE